MPDNLLLLGTGVAYLLTAAGRGRRSQRAEHLGEMELGTGERHLLGSLDGGYDVTVTQTATKRAYTMSSLLPSPGASQEVFKNNVLPIPCSDLIHKSFAV